MDKKERKRMLNSLNKKRGRLVKGGASPESVRDYMGFGASEKIGTKSDSEIKSLYNASISKPTIKIVNGVVLPKKYVTRANKWFDGNEHKFAGSYQKAINSNLMQDPNLKELSKRKKSFDRKMLKKYGDEVERLGNGDLAKRVKSLTKDQFSAFLKADPNVSFSAIFYYPENTEFTNEENEQSEAEYLNSTFNAIENALDSLLKVERR